MERKRLVAGGILAIIGVFFIVFPLLPSESKAESRAWESVSVHGHTATGFVFDVDSEVRGNRRNIHTVYCPVFAFTVDGERGVARAQDGDCKATRGEARTAPPAEIIFDPANPELAFVNSPETQSHYDNVNSIVWVALVFGLPLLLMGGYGVWSARPKSLEQQAVIEGKRRMAREQSEQKLAKANADAATRKAARDAKRLTKRK